MGFNYKCGDCGARGHDLPNTMLKGFRCQKCGSSRVWLP